MEIIPEGKNFRLVHDDELPSILKVLEKHLPYSLKVRLMLIIYCLDSFDNDSFRSSALQKNKSTKICYDITHKITIFLLFLHSHLNGILLPLAFLTTQTWVSVSFSALWIN